MAHSIIVEGFRSILTPLDALGVLWTASAAWRQHFFPKICDAWGYMAMNPYVDSAAGSFKGRERVPWLEPGTGRGAFKRIESYDPKNREGRARSPTVRVANPTLLRRVRN